MEVPRLSGRHCQPAPPGKTFATTWQDSVGNRLLFSAACRWWKKMDDLLTGRGIWKPRKADRQTMMGCPKACQPGARAGFDDDRFRLTDKYPIRSAKVKGRSLASRKSWHPAVRGRRRVVARRRAGCRLGTWDAAIIAHFGSECGVSRSPGRCHCQPAVAYLSINCPSPSVPKPLVPGDDGTPVPVPVHPVRLLGRASDLPESERSRAHTHQQAPALPCRCRPPTPGQSPIPIPPLAGHTPRTLSLNKTHHCLAVSPPPPFILLPSRPIALSPASTTYPNPNPIVQTLEDKQPSPVHSPLIDAVDAHNRPRLHSQPPTHLSTPCRRPISAPRAASAQPPTAARD